MLDFFLETSGSTWAVPDEVVTEAPCVEAGEMVAGRAGRAGVTSNLRVLGGGGAGIELVAGLTGGGVANTGGLAALESAAAGVWASWTVGAAELTAGVVGAVEPVSGFPVSGRVVAAALCGAAGTKLVGGFRASGVVVAIGAFGATGPDNGRFGSGVVVATDDT